MCYKLTEGSGVLSVFYCKEDCYSPLNCPIGEGHLTHTNLIESEAFTQALYNLIDLKIIDLDEYQGLIDNFTTTEELDAYLTAREGITI